MRRVSPKVYRERLVNEIELLRLKMTNIVGWYEMGDLLKAGIDDLEWAKGYVNKHRVTMLCNSGEEPTTVMIRGHVTEVMAYTLAKGIMEDQDFDDVEETLEHATVKPGYTRWAEATEEQKAVGDDWAEPCEQDDPGAFATTMVDLNI